MWRLIGLVCCASLAAADLTGLRQLEEKNRIFELREALQQPGWSDAETLFYRAVVAARFGHESTAIEQLQTVLAAHPNAGIERKAYEELSAALVRIGNYGESARALAQALRLTPPDDPQHTENENTRVLYEALRDVAPENVQFGQDAPIEATYNPVGSWNVPVEVNGHTGEWIFDTGANFSTLIESEAKNMGLAIREAGAYVNGSTDKKNPLRLAVASNLRFGSAHVSNVVFLVIADQALHIGPVKYQIRGILGLPVLRVLERVGISSKGEVRIEPDKQALQGEPNLFFQELTPLLDTRHGDHRVQMFLDTGANKSFIFPSFRSAFTQADIGSLKKKREKMGGAGGVVKLRSEMLPHLKLDIAGQTVGLSKVSLLARQPAGDAGKRDGVLGIDALTAGFTLDFRTMQLEIE